LAALNCCFLLVTIAQVVLSGRAVEPAFGPVADSNPAVGVAAAAAAVVVALAGDDSLIDPSDKLVWMPMHVDGNLVDRASKLTKMPVVQAPLIPVVNPEVTAGAPVGPPSVAAWSHRVQLHAQVWHPETMEQAQAETHD
jgi:hypothetical protein